MEPDSSAAGGHEVAGSSAPGPEPISSDVFSGGGEMGARMSAFDWSATNLGPPNAWPQSLKTTIGIMLTSRYAMWMAWGPELTFFCNDAYEPTLGVKSAWALGARSDHVWAEIWKDIGPRIQRVLQTGAATWDEGLLLFLERSGYPEETYHTFSYSPLRDDAGAVSGMLCVVTEETERVIGERRLSTLRDLATGLANTKTEAEVAASIRRSLGEKGRDLPFTLTYTFEPGGAARLVCQTGLPDGHPAGPALISADAARPWKPAAMRQPSKPLKLDDLATLGSLPTGGWDQPPRQVLLQPIAQQGQDSAAGFLVTALNPFRALDGAYEGFLELVAGQIAASLANARAYAEERKRAESLAELDRAKTAFFSNISHEFRTPLTLMLGPLEEVIAQPHATVPASEREKVEAAHRNGLRLLKLVNTLLDFSRIEAGRIQATYRPTDLAAYTAELASSFRSAMRSAGLDFTIETRALLHPVLIDTDMWEKIVLNLLSNAFKFTLEGGVGLTLKASPDGASAVLSVRDSGAGIPDDELPRLFERFHRVEGTAGRTFEGSGIGLALVQELVKLHGGSIHVESVVGKGSTFTVSLPFGASHLPADRIADGETPSSDGLRARSFVEEACRWLPDGGSAQDAENVAALADGLADEAALPAGSGGRLVLADDNSDMRDYIRRLLVARGYQVEAVGDGQAALEAIRRDPPDLVLSDVMMPRLDGFGLLAEIRADQDLSDMAVMLLSARAGEEARVQGVDAGADDYLTKPFSARELVARVGANINLARVRRAAVEALRTLNETLETRVAERTRERDRVWRLSRELMLAAGPDLTAQATNPAWAHILGWEEVALVGRNVFELVHVDDQETTAAELASLIPGKRSQLRFECRMRHHDGGYRSIEWAAVAEDGVIYGVGRDVTEARAAAERLRQAQKMETIGQLTGGVAHDFNNLLTVIIGNLETIRRNIGDTDDARGSRLRRASENAMRGAQRAAALTQRLLAFSRRQPLDPRPVDANRLIGGMADLLNRSLGEHIDVETVAGAGLWLTNADPNQLESALLNLAVNARDAMPDGGKLTIETGNAYLDDRYTASASEVVAGQYVLIAVSDTGAGMSKAVLAQAFEPFFTTKDVGHGTGLGLSQVYGFVKQSGGHVKLYSEPGEGTTVKIYLPRLVGHESRPDQEELDGRAPKGDSTDLILVVEDDNDVRSYSTEALRDLGYRVLEAQDGASALQVLDRNRDIRLLFTDIGLPGGMDGRALARAARLLQPRLQILFTTGYARNAIVHGGRLDPGVNLITKPFTYQALASKVRDVLEAAAAPPRILLVEDEALVRMAVVDTLNEAGFATEEAANGAEALAKVRAAIDRFDAVILDVGLPDRTGDQLATELRALRRELPIVIASGYDKELLERLFAQDPHVRLVAKPYFSEDLSEALRRLGVDTSVRG